VVKNWLRGDRVGRIKIALAPHAGVDPETMRELMIEAARAQEGVLRIPAPQVMFLGMEPASYRFELWCYVEDVEKSARVRSDLHFDLHRRLREAGISIAAPSAPPAPLMLQMTEIEKLTAAAAATALALQAEFAIASGAAATKGEAPAADATGAPQSDPAAPDDSETRATEA
jgi:small-conductance mechanosensitive channel